MTKLDVIQPNLNTRSVYDFEFEIASLRCVTTINVYNYVTTTVLEKAAGTWPRSDRCGVVRVAQSSPAKLRRSWWRYAPTAHAPWPSRRGEGEEAEVGLARILQFPPRLLPRSVA